MARRAAQVLLLALLAIMGVAVGPLAHVGAGMPRAAAAGPYSITDLGTLGIDSFALGINTPGQVAGYSDVSSTVSSAFYWDQSTGMRSLGTLGGSNSFAYGINDMAQVVGEADTISGTSHAFSWNATMGMRDLGTFGGNRSLAEGINNLGQVVGAAETLSNTLHAFRTAPNSLINPLTDDLGTLGGKSSAAFGINASGQVIGLAFTTGGLRHAFRTAPNSPINPLTDDLGTLPERMASAAFGINASGQVVGFSSYTATTQSDLQTALAFIWNQGTGMRSLGTLGGPTSDALGINDLGQVVGAADVTTSTSHAFLWDPTSGMQDLNNLLPTGAGWALVEADGINNAGQIVGFGVINNQNHAFLLTPASPVTPTTTPTSTPTATPTNTATSTPTNTSTPAPTNTSTPAPTNTSTPAPTSTPTSTATATRTSTPPNTATSMATPTQTARPPVRPTSAPTATPTPHHHDNPITDPWPKLTAAEHKAVQNLINSGKKKQALDKLVEIMKKYCCNFDTMKGGHPIYDPRLEGEGTTERKKGGEVRIGPAAFTNSHWLYSSLKHEMVHSQQWQNPDAADTMGSNARERQAYQREIDNAGNTGISKAEKKELERRLKTYR